MIAQAVGAECAGARDGGRRPGDASSVPGCGPVIVNAGQSGYYRTLYAPAQFARDRRRLREAGADRPARRAERQLGARPAPGCSPPRTCSTWSRPRPSMPIRRSGATSPTTSTPSTRAYRGDAARQAALRALRDRAAGAGVRAGRLGTRARTSRHRSPILRDDADRDAGRARRCRRDRRGAPSLRGAGRRPGRDAGGTAQDRSWRWSPRHADAATWDRLHAAAKAEKTPLVKDELYVPAGHGRRRGPGPARARAGAHRRAGGDQHGRHDPYRRPRRIRMPHSTTPSRTSNRSTRWSIRPRAAAITRTWATTRWIRR